MLGTAKHTLSLQMARPPVHPGMLVSLHVRDAPPWMDGVPLPAPLGFSVSRASDGVVMAQGGVDAAGYGAVGAGVLKLAEAYVLQLVSDATLANAPTDDAAARALFSAADVDIDGPGSVTEAEHVANRQRRLEEARNAARFEPDATLRFTATGGAARQEVRL